MDHSTLQMRLFEKKCTGFSTIPAGLHVYSTLHLVLLDISSHIYYDHKMTPPPLPRTRNRVTVETCENNDNFWGNVAGLVIISKYFCKYISKTKPIKTACSYTTSRLVWLLFLCLPGHSHV